MLSKESTEILEIIAKIAEKLATGSISLETARQLADSGTLDGSPSSLPAIGSRSGRRCVYCEETLPHTFATAFFSGKEGQSYTVFGWRCETCGRMPITVYDTRSDAHFRKTE